SAAWDYLGRSSQSATYNHLGLRLARRLSSASPAIPVLGRTSLELPTVGNILVASPRSHGLILRPFHVASLPLERMHLVQCWRCKTNIEVTPQNSGQKIACQSCAQVLTLPRFIPVAQAATSIESPSAATPPRQKPRYLILGVITVVALSAI